MDFSAIVYTGRVTNWRVKTSFMSRYLGTLTLRWGIGLRTYECGLRLLVTFVNIVLEIKWKTKNTTSSEQIQNPTDKPSKQNPTDKPSKQNPTDKPSKQNPTDKPSKQNPTDKPSKQNPTDKPSKQNQTDKPSKQNRYPFLHYIFQLWYFKACIGYIIPGTRRAH
jgi:hypothetical protein